MVSGLPSNRNPFVYGRVLQPSHAACARPVYEAAILETARSSGRLALVGDRRLGKSSLVERTLAKAKQPVLRWDFHQILSMDDIVRRVAEEFDVFVRNLSPVARRITPWLREIASSRWISERKIPSTASPSRFGNRSRAVLLCRQCAGVLSWHLCKRGITVF